MKAAVVHAFGEPPSFEDFEEPTPIEDDVVVSVTAAALYQRVRGEATGQHYSSDGLLPLIPGFDGVGRLPDGGRVCFLTAHPGRGSLAQRTAVPVRHLVEIPDDVDDLTAAVMLNPAMSGWLALRDRAVLQAGEGVLILGATGAAGRAAVQLAKLLGASTIVGAGRNETMLGRLPGLGCSAVVSLDQTSEAVREDLARVAADVDIVLDYLWGPQAELALAAITEARADPSRRLRWVHIGAQAGSTARLLAATLRRSNVQISGSGTGAVAPAQVTAQLIELVGHLGSLQVSTEPVATPLSEVGSVWSAAPEPGRRVVFEP